MSPDANAVEGRAAMLKAEPRASAKAVADTVRVVRLDLVSLRG